MPLPEPMRLELEAIDAAIAGEAVDPRYADLAELALLLGDSRPALEPERAARLDRRIADLDRAWQPGRTSRRFRRGGQDRPRLRRDGSSRPWFLRPAYGAGLALVAALALAVIVVPHGGGSSSNRSLSAHGLSVHSPAAPTHGASSSSSSAASAGSQAGAGSSGAGSSSAGSAGATGGASSSAAGQSAPAVPTTAAATTATPAPNGRRIIQSAQLALSAARDRISAVSQELFDVVGAERGIVERSQITTGAGGYASFSLSIPSANLSATLARLGQLRSAQVTSSSASTSDVNSRYVDDRRRLADARALRTSLLTQLESASTTIAIDSLKAQIRDAETAITRDEAGLNALRGRIAYSTVAVTISPSGTVATPSRGGGLTVHRALRDALDVLRVAAGVALIALAVLLPLGLILIVMAWLARLWRRHGRERALDGA